MIDFEIINKKLFENIREKLLQVLNSADEFKNAKIVASPRSIGDLVQDFIGESLPNLLPQGSIKNYKSDFPRRALPDIAFYDQHENYYIIDVKTHNKGTKFNMPNLISVERLSKLYKHDNNIFVILLAEYIEKDGKAYFEDIKFAPIENFSWSCLTLGALGWGQIQISNANKILIDYNLTRKMWMLNLCEKLELFYPKEIEKLKNRMSYFAQIKKFWDEK